MTLDLTKPVQTRGGMAVRILATDIKGDHPIAGVVTYLDGVETLENWAADGRWFNGQDEDTVLDLVQADVWFEGWINLYPAGRASMVYPSREQADIHANHRDRLACHFIRVKQGEGL